MRNGFIKYFFPIFILLWTGYIYTFTSSSSTDLPALQISQRSSVTISEDSAEQHTLFSNYLIDNTYQYALFSEVIDVKDEKVNRYFSNLNKQLNEGSFTTLELCSLQLGLFFIILEKNALFFIHYPSITKFRRLIKFQIFRI